MTRARTLVLGVLLVGLSVAAGKVLAQGSGAFLCSQGTRDGQSCASAADCPGGVCIRAQAVCDGGSDDGVECTCAGATCSQTPACATDAALGTCSGGPVAGACCGLDSNCAAGGACTGTQKICVGASGQGKPCVRDAQCSPGVCRSTGKFCLGVCQSGAHTNNLCTTSADCGEAQCTSDFQDLGCTVDTDCCTGGSVCPAGICHGEALTPTPTPSPPAVTPTTARPTASRTPTRTPPPTVTAVPTRGTATPTRLPAGQSIVVLAAAAGARDLALQDATSFPESGVIELVLDATGTRGNPTVGYSRAVLSNTLSLDAPLAQAVPAGTIVRSSPRGGMVFESVAQGGGCALRPGGTGGGSALLGLVAALVLVLRRCRPLG